MESLEKILNRMDELDNIIEKKNCEFIKRVCGGSENDNFQNYLLNTIKEREELQTLCVEYIKIAPYNLSDLDDYGDHMGIYDFIKYCNEGVFIDNDGHGHLCVGNKKTDLVILPSYVFQENFDCSRFDGVIWYNK